MCTPCGHRAYARLQAEVLTLWARVAVRRQLDGVYTPDSRCGTVKVQKCDRTIDWGPTLRVRL